MSSNNLFSLVLATALIAGCATVAPDAKTAAQVPIYPSDRLSEGRYRIVKRLWVESARSAFVVPEYSSEQQGLDALKTAAAGLGANGLTMVACYKDGKGQLPLRFSSRPVFICYGNAIRVGD